MLLFPLSIGYSVVLQTLFKRTPVLALWKTLIGPRAPLANDADALFHNGAVNLYDVALVSLVKAFSYHVISNVLSPLDFAKLSAANLAWEPPDQNTLPLPLAALLNALPNLLGPNPKPEPNNPYSAPAL